MGIWLGHIILACLISFTDISMIITIRLKATYRLISISLGYFYSYLVSYFTTIPTVLWMSADIFMENIQYGFSFSSYQTF